VNTEWLGGCGIISTGPICWGKLAHITQIIPYFIVKSKPWYSLLPPLGILNKTENFSFPVKNLPVSWLY
jgi:hypothetical protein